MIQPSCLMHVGKRGISRCWKTRVFLCVYLCALSTHCLCMADLKRWVLTGLWCIIADTIFFTLHRFKHQALSKRICRQLVRLPSLGLGRGVRCGQRIHGRLVTSFTVQKSFVKRIRVSELHLTACSLMDALLTSSLPCASVSCGVHLVLSTGQTPVSLSCAPKSYDTP